MRFSDLFLTSAVLLAPTTAFIFEATQTRRPELATIVDAQPDTRVAVGLDVGKSDEGSSRLAVKGLVLDLFQSAPQDDHVKMPGTDGPHPELSAGLRKLEFVEDGQFVSLQGVKRVTGSKGSWEIVWKEGAPAGSLLCGFEVPESYTRNDATLPKGCIYLSFPVWTAETLLDMQGEKQRIMDRASEALKEKNRELKKINETNNPFEKLWFYRNAAAAAEKYSIVPISRAKLVPEQNEVIALSDDLLVTTKGTIWTKKSNGHQVLLGSATLNIVPKDV